MKNIFKRSLCLLTAILILCASASAAAPQEALDIPEISPRYAYIRDTEADLEIPGDWLIVQHLFLPLPLLMMWN